MNRTAKATFLGLALGVVAGYAAAHFFGNDSASTALPNGRANATPPARPAATHYNPPVVAKRDVPTHAERTEAYRWAEHASVDDLVTRIAELAADARTPRQLRLAEALFTRYAEIDPQNAIGMARAYGFPHTLTAELYGLWAAADTGTALDALREEPDRRLALEAGLHVLDLLTPNRTSIEQVLSALPTDIDRPNATAAALGRIADRDIDAALAIAQSLNDADGRATSLRQIAQRVAAEDPELAYTKGDQIADAEVRLSYVSMVLREWTRADPQTVLGMLPDVVASGPAMGRVLWCCVHELARVDPQGLIELADQTPRRVGHRITQQAVQAWARQDSQAAIAFVEAQTPGRQRDELGRQAAIGFAASDPEAALEWFKSTSPGRGGLGAIVSQVAQDDFDKGFELALKLEQTAEGQGSLQHVVMRFAYAGEGRNIADRLLAIDDERVRTSGLQMLASSWIEQEPEAASAWLVDNVDVLSSESLARMSSRLAQTDPQVAVRLTERIPTEARSAWIRNVAAGYADYDPEAALGWLSQYSGTAGYDDALTAVAAKAAERDPIGAARRVENMADGAQAATVAAVAGQHWSRQDPAAAAAWAAKLNSAEVRDAAAASVASQYARHDPQAAADWALRLPAGIGRDQALMSMLGHVDSSNGLDPRLMNAFNDDRMRQRGVVYAAYRSARTDRAAARALLQRHVTDADILQLAEQQLARVR